MQIKVLPVNSFKNSPHFKFNNQVQIVLKSLSGDILFYLNLCTLLQSTQWRKLRRWSHKFSCSLHIETSLPTPKEDLPSHGESWPVFQSWWSVHSRRTSSGVLWHCGGSSFPKSLFSSHQRTDKWTETSRMRVPSCNSTKYLKASHGRGSHTNNI